MNGTQTHGHRGGRAPKPQFASTSTAVALIQPAQFYSVAYVAGLLGLHETTVYQAAGGAKGTPVPRSTKIGKSVRFLGLDVLAYIAQHTGEDAALALSGGAFPSARPAAAAAAQPQQPRRRGRPRKVAAEAVGGAA